MTTLDQKAAYHASALKSHSMESMAAQQDALAELREVLKEMGIRSTVETHICLVVGYKRGSDKEIAFPVSEPPIIDQPILRVFGPGKEEIATAVVGGRSGSYLVTVPAVSKMPKVVRPGSRPSLNKIGIDILHAYKAVTGGVVAPALIATASKDE
ncbi:hypothetical protein [Nonomuraea sp. NPDC048916]|uniref:hypothetical protein n=1 Tax=Nonomuraea sp. NPDC048916 TaxID=3154232 RepID=UPI0033EC78D6